MKPTLQAPGAAGTIATVLLALCAGGCTYFNEGYYEPGTYKPAPQADATVCHDGATLGVSHKQEKEHLAHGDTRGKCPDWR